MAVHAGRGAAKVNISLAGLIAQATPKRSRRQARGAFGPTPEATSVQARIRLLVQPPISSPGSQGEPPRQRSPQTGRILLAAKQVCFFRWGAAPAHVRAERLLFRASWGRLIKTLRWSR